MPILRVSDLSKSYKDVRAVDKITFDVMPGEVVGFLGPNGAGKTTTINMILGLLTPSSGRIEIFGEDITRDRTEVNAHTNFAAVYAQVPGNMTVWQCLYVFGKLYSVQNLKSRIEELIKEFDLEQFRNTHSGLLSSGELSRLNLAKAVINRPRLLLLDEPTASLDPNVALSIRGKVLEYAQANQSSVLWTSHNMKEIEEVCNRVFFLSKGRILLSGDPKELPAKHGKRDLEELFIAIAREPLNFKE